MNRIFAAFFAGIILLTGCSTDGKETAATTPDMPIDSLFEAFYQDWLKLFPIQATYQGDNRYNDLAYNSETQEFRNRQIAYYSGYLEKLKQYDIESLDDMDRTSYQVMQWDCQINLEGMAFPYWLMPVTQNSAFPLTLVQLGSGEGAQPFETVQDYDNWIKRLQVLPQWCDTAIVNMKRGMSEGYTQPAVLISKTIPQIAEFDHGPVEDHIFYNVIATMPDSFPAAEKERLEALYRQNIEELVIPSFARFRTFLEDEYLPACRTTAGISEVPGGREYYDFLIKYYTTTTMSVDDIYALGLSEVGRITEEMEEVKKEIGFEGDLKAFFDYVRTDKQFTPYTDAQQVIDNFNLIHEVMKPQLEKLFDKVPNAGFEVRRTESYREATASWEYYPPSLDGSRPGIFYVPVPDVKKYNKYADENTFLHEAIPGHHYQIALQQENTNLPSFRKSLWYSAYGEGWALYTESLGKELGLYQDPVQYFGGLGWDMHRAIRLVVDAGMHVKGMTREEAIQYSLDHEAEPEHTIISEIERYMADPGQALSYKIGQLKIRELRSKAEKELGDNFDIREFHNIILEPGCIPLAVLEDIVNRWIAAKKVIS